MNYYKLIYNYNMKLIYNISYYKKYINYVYLIVYDIII